MSSSLENATSTRVIGYARPVLLIITLLALTGIGHCHFVARRTRETCVSHIFK